MEWVTFTKEITKRGRMIFWDKKERYWFEGNLIDDSEYGLCISLEEGYRTLKDISNYFIPETP